ncbi:hypothetical protein D3C78_19360 [compost metagenome]
MNKKQWIWAIIITTLIITIPTIYVFSIANTQKASVTIIQPPDVEIGSIKDQTKESSFVLVEETQPQPQSTPANKPIPPSPSPSPIFNTKMGQVVETKEIMIWLTRAVLHHNQLTIQLTLKNNSSQSLDETVFETVTLSDKKPVETISFKIEPGESIAISYSFDITEAGDHIFTINEKTWLFKITNKKD